MARLFVAIAAILAGLAVALGAFASHGLKEKISDRSLDIFETGARYQMYHALALLAVGILLSRLDLSSQLLSGAGIAFLAGIALFSGSLYALSLTGIKWLGAVAPLGGLAFLIGWGCVAIAAFTLKEF